MEKLKPCPFCGGEAEVLRNPIINGAIHNAVVHCEECKARTTIYVFEKDAIEAWNTRAVDERFIDDGK